MDPILTNYTQTRRKIRVNGTVQGVGFRPYVYKLARELKLTGHVSNGSDGVTIEVEGDAPAVLEFQERLPHEAPALARIESIDSRDIHLLGDASFVIQPSQSPDEASTDIPPDIAVCQACLREMNDTSDRRYRYPFTNCTNCGPRFTIVRSVPYDRPATSMAAFRMCDDCRHEYNDPTNRRFHAQPIACPECGPKIWIHDGNQIVPVPDEIDFALKALSNGQILALRGLGGFHLAVNAFDETAVQKLRDRKRRLTRPFAVMVRSVEAAGKFCYLNDNERRLLADPRAPIVLLGRRPESELAASISIDNDRLGLMLPYTPLHHLLLAGDLDALVMTSGNTSDEPITIDNDDALGRLGHIADIFLLHDREILGRCDDSIVTMVDGDRQIIRRSRGFVPEPVAHTAGERIILGAGAELKNVPAIKRRSNVYLAQHIGDLDNPLALDFYTQAIKHLCRTHDVVPDIIACDMHPEYLSTKWAQAQPDCQIIEVQHHHAHLASLMVDNQLTQPIAALVMDGTGYGLDGTIWGGEILCGNCSGFERAAWLDPVPMPGGAAAIKEPARMAAGYLYAAGIPTDQWPRLLNMTANDLGIIRQAIDRNMNCPLTSSCGRLFDAVAALLGVGDNVSYEAQAAIRLETLASSCGQTDLADMKPVASGIQGALPVSRLIRQIVDGLRKGRSKSGLALEFHQLLTRMLVDAGASVATARGINQIGLTGGVWQNRLLYTMTRDALVKRGFEVIVHQQVPCNDGGIALGQIAVATALLSGDNATLTQRK